VHGYEEAEFQSDRENRARDAKDKVLS